MGDLTIALSQKEKLQVKDDEHPCDTLSFSDNWWMISWNKKHLCRFSPQKQMGKIIIPELMIHNEHGYAAACK